MSSIPTPQFATVAERESDKPTPKKPPARRNGRSPEKPIADANTLPVAVPVPTNWSAIDWHTIPVAEGTVLLSELQRTWEHAAKVMQQRQQAAQMVKCHCGCNRRLAPSQACMSKAMRDPATLLPYNVYFATQECVRQHNRKTMGLKPNEEALPR